MALTDRQQRFVDEYLIDLNASAAYQRAGYKAKGNAAEVSAHHLLRNPKIAAAVAEAQQARAARTRVTADRVLQELAAVAFSNVSHYRIADSGEIVLAEGAPADAVAAVSSAKRKTRTDAKGNTETDVEIKLWNKVGALKLCMDHLGMLKTQVGTGEIVPIVIMPDNGRGDGPSSD